MGQRKEWKAVLEPDIRLIRTNYDQVFFSTTPIIFSIASDTASSTDEKGIIFNDRQNNIPVIKDVWDEKKKRIKARNFAIFAPTGEGKSLRMALVIISDNQIDTRRGSS